MIMTAMTQKEILGLIIAIVALIIIAGAFTVLLYFYNKSDKKNIFEGKKDIELIDQDLYLTKESVKRRNFILKIVENVIFYVVLAILVPLIIVSVISRANGDYFMIGGKGIIAVGSDSMAFKNIANGYISENNLENQVYKNDLISISKVKEEDLKLYDVIVFKNDEGIIKIHRIIEMPSAENGYRYETRGDSNNMSDSYHPVYKDIIGRYDNKRMGGVGLPTLFLSSYIGIFTIVTLLYCLFVVSFFRQKSNKVKEERLKKISIIFNPEKNKTVLEGSLYYLGYKYNYADNKFVSKEAIESGKMRKLSDEKIIKEENGSLEEIEIEYFDPIYQEDNSSNELDSMIEELENKKKQSEGNKND